ncbi:SRPBCC family protein [Prauserella muralis]|uniref:Polyketide cyclase n=1 Tax=Prauserella muralis TaxID=588067 RepID=A0A2V4B7E5_9PSEU|nr:SRPBCC family protein [Prauserella muralis]PXY31305.1 polyketide cyclase [Prauserella muralis]TWE14378.1 polyketide cyclase/dehydrase/lipid transport protein [Prauserella muralis]
MIGRRFTFEVRRVTSAAPETLFRLETDGAGWSRWARPLVPRSRWAREGDPAPAGAGAVREVGLWPLLVRERTVEYEPHRRHVYTFDGARPPVRDYRAEVLLTPDGSGGTELLWRGSFTEAVPGTGPLARTLLRAAIRFLSARLVRAAEAGRG